MSIPLWAHQQAAVDQLAPLGRGGLWFEMGAGKTRVALALATDHWDCRRILVICPKAVIRVWPKELAAWQAGEASVLIVQLQAGAEGNDFTRARIQVYYALYFNAGSYQQTRARIMRPGQSQDVTYIHLVCAGTVDDIIYEVLRKREELVQGVLRRLGRRGKAT